MVMLNWVVKIVKRSHCETSFRSHCELIMEQKHKVIAVIVNYNKPFDTLRCIKAIVQNSQKPSAIIVVDNASTDNSVSILQDCHQIKLIINSQNKGGSGGFNTGIEAALKYNPDYV